MHPKMISHAAVLKLNKKLFENCLADVDEQTGQRRPNERTNNMIFLAVHIVDARYFLARMLGAEATWSVSKSLEGVERVEDLEEYPSMEEIRTAWQKVSHLLAERFSKITDHCVKRVAEHGDPGPTIEAVSALPADQHKAVPFMPCRPVRDAGIIRTSEAKFRIETDRYGARRTAQIDDTAIGSKERNVCLVHGDREYLVKPEAVLTERNIHKSGFSS